MLWKKFVKVELDWEMWKTTTLGYRMRFRLLCSNRECWYQLLLYAACWIKQQPIGDDKRHDCWKKDTKGLNWCWQNPSRLCEIANCEQQIKIELYENFNTVRKWNIMEFISNPLREIKVSIYRLRSMLLFFALNKSELKWIWIWSKTLIKDR